MSDIVNVTGARIRAYRHAMKLSREALAELADLHPVYIGQLERGEKNMTLRTLAKIATALDVTPEHLLTNLPAAGTKHDYIPSLVYDLLLGLKRSQQQQLYEIVKRIIDCIS